MNATKLKHIVTIYQHGSISAAARSLGLTQSTVSRSLADIEAEVGYSLFDRRARDVVATERGRPFINRAARIISDLDQFSEDARASREAGDTLIRVGVSPASMQGLINTAIRTLSLRDAALRVHLEAASTASGVRALRRGDIDILVGPERDMSNDAAFSVTQLGQLKTHLFARKRHPLAAKSSVTRSDLKAFPVIAPDRMSWHTERLRTLYASMGGDSARRMHVIEYFPLVADMVAGSDAIGVIGAEYSASKAFTRRFSLLDIPFFEPLAVGYAVRKRWLPTQAVRAFQTVLQEYPPSA